ncbi:MAG: MarR family transcriptional regulator [Proteobacteria bacterium]|nr:MarR family transcriptional regulator [Pseudomonadota bacterium]
MKLTQVMERYILHWGEMGTRWGVNRSVAQIHALLYLSDRSLPADEIADTLGIARSNVSTSLRELQSWNLVQLSHVMRDRRDHFVAKEDTWEILMTIVEGRKRREIDPTIAMLKECAAAAETDRETSEVVKERITRMLTFMETLANWYEQVRRLPKPTLVKLMNLGARIAKFVAK